MPAIEIDEKIAVERVKVMLQDLGWSIYSGLMMGAGFALAWWLLS
jgi:hypothetical protein